MTAIKGFNGVRYPTENISKLICPPYDVISDEQKAALKKMSANNMVLLELPDAKGSANKYRNAVEIYKKWRAERVLRRDNTSSIYVYEQVFSDHGVKKVRRGFFAALKIENPFKGQVKPHERTLAKPKQDRLNMIRAVKANLSPIFGLYNDNSKTTVRLIASISKRKPDSIAKDKDGVSHKMWCINDTKTVSSIIKVLKNTSVFIADGHHRYETSWNYLGERAKKEKHLSSNASCRFVMTFLCPMEDPGLSIWPTHRVVVEPTGFEKKIEKYFSVLPAGEFKKRSDKSPQPLLVYKKGIARTLVIKNRKVLDIAMKGKVSAYKNLGVSILHSVLLDNVLPEHITYVKDEKEAKKLADKRKCIAVMVPSTPMKALKDIATAGQTMPQKSTYFYPKVASGIVIHDVA